MLLYSSDLILYLGTIIEYLLRMKSKQLLVSVFVLVFVGMANAQLNKYKYIIVPKKFDAFKEQNMHQTSTMIKFLFSQEGFTTTYDDLLPEDLASDRCLGLVADLEDNSNLFSTRTTLVLKDCNGAEVFRSIEGRSKIKEFKAAYRESVSNTFAPIKSLGYTYTPKDEKTAKKESKTVTVSFKDDVNSVNKQPDSKVVQQTATQEEQSYKSVEPVASNITKSVVSKPAESNVLYAQPTENGYQLVDSSPKVVLKLIKTSVDNIFLIDDDTKNGMVFKKGDKWLLEYADGNGKKQEELNIKF